MWKANKTMCFLKYIEKIIRLLSGIFLKKVFFLQRTGQNSASMIYELNRSIIWTGLIYILSWREEAGLTKIHPEAQPLLDLHYVNALMERTMMNDD